MSDIGDDLDAGQGAAGLVLIWGRVERHWHRGRFDDFQPHARQRMTASASSNPQLMCYRPPHAVDAATITYVGTIFRTGYSIAASKQVHAEGSPQ
jgi:hypothetical protein